MRIDKPTRISWFLAAGLLECSVEQQAIMFRNKNIFPMKVVAVETKQRKVGKTVSHFQPSAMKRPAPVFMFMLIAMVEPISEVIKLQAK